MDGRFRSPLQRAGREAVDQELADQDREERDREHDNGAAGGDLGPLPALVIPEVGDRDRGVIASVRLQDQGTPAGSRLRPAGAH
jgi:hypothetical protein